jgi:ATP-binding cassette subfamily F protein 3
MKLLEKMDKVVVDEVDDNAIAFKFPSAPHSGKVTVEAKQLSLGYGALNVLSSIDMHLERGERVAFVGRNGEGKSTFVKSIVGELTPQSGTIQLGHQVVIGYYAQNQVLLLNPNKTVFETIDEVAEGDIRPKIRTILGRFLFSTEDTEKKVSVLSGGEKSRLALAKLLLSPFNLLILDEPTNHLDMASKDVLKNALLHYTGSLIVVSHDRDFLTGLCDKIFEFKDKKIKTFIGDVFDFLEKKKLDSLNELQSKMKHRSGEEKYVSENKENYLLKKEQEAQQRKIKNQLKKLEAEIENIQKELHTIEMQLVQPKLYADKMEFGSLYIQYEKLKNNIAEKEEKWMELQE